MSQDIPERNLNVILPDIPDIHRKKDFISALLLFHQLFDIKRTSV
jgi:hypothetical protein